MVRKKSWRRPRARCAGRTRVAVRSECAHLRSRLAMMILYMPKVNMPAIVETAASEDMPPPGRLRRTSTVG